MATPLNNNSLEKALDKILSQIDAHKENSKNPHCITLEQMRTKDNRLSGDINMGGNTILGLSTPKFNDEIANKRYVDNRQHNSDFGNPHCVTLEQVRFKNNVVSGNIDMDCNRIVSLGPGVNSQDAVTKEQVDTDTSNAHFNDFSNPHCVTLSQALNKGNVTTSNISMSGNQIVSLSDPLNPLDGATKNYIDTNTNQDHFLDLNNPHCTDLETARAKNNKVQGNIDMDGRKMVLLADPVLPTDAANKKYTDSIVTVAPVIGSTGTQGVFNTLCIDTELKVGTEFKIGNSRRGFTVTGFSSSEVNFGIDVDSSGKIIVAGFAEGATRDFLVVKYDQFGDPDISFNGTGFLQFDFGVSTDVAYSVVVDGSDNIFLAGTTDDSGTNDFAVIKLTSNGIFNPFFGVGGIATVDFGGTEDYGKKVLIDGLGRVIIVGYSDQGGTFIDFAITRLTSTGILDLTFNGTGKLTVSVTVGAFLDVGYSAALDGSDNIVIGGFGIGNVGVSTNLMLVKVTAAGVLDGTFGAGGIVEYIPVFPNVDATEFIGQTLTPPSGTPDSEAAEGSLKIDGSGNILLSGTVAGNFIVVRFDSAGVPDPGFGIAGQVTLDFLGGTDFGFAVDVDSLGRIIVGGGD